jgi:hypothetical protein
MGGIKEFFDGLSKATDILNLGRLIFYTTAGALVVLPTYMIAAQMFELRLVTNIDLASWHAAGLFLCSMVVGFLVATVAFPLVLDEVSRDVRREMAADGVTPDDTYSFPRNYPMLRGKPGDDYAAWLISEYYRYVEIAAYIPLGAIAGLVLTEVYLLVVLVQQSIRHGHPGITMTHLLFAAILGALVMIRYWLWPQVWAKRVVAPTIRTYLSAKRNLIDGVKGQQATSMPGATKAG